MQTVCISKLHPGLFCVLGTSCLTETNIHREIHSTCCVFWSIIMIGNTMVYYRVIWWFLVFNATFSNISAISWRPVLVVEEATIPGENHRPWASKLVSFITWRLRLRVECTLFCNLQSRAWTHIVLVIGFYELLGNPTT